MSTNQKRSASGDGRAARRWRRLTVVAIVVVGAGVYGLTTWLAEAGPPTEAVALFSVRRGPLRISVTESGTVKSREKVVLKSEVEGRTTILSLVPEGMHAKKGDLLVELDASSLIDSRTKQQITVLNAEADYVRAREDLAVTQSQGESDVAEAELEHKFAKLDLKKYLEGEYPQELQKAENEITLAEEELQRAKDKLEWSQKLAREGYLSQIEVKADELAAKRSQLDLELAKGKKHLLETYTYQRNVEQYESNVEQTAKALDRVQRRAKADMVQAQAQLKAKESEFKRQKDQLEKIVRQIAKCKVHAPVAGLVVYATTGRGGWRGNQEPLDEGQDVRERQELIHLPTTNSMIAEVKVHESSLTKVHPGLAVRVVIDALPGRTFAGRVRKIGLLPDAQMAWLNPDLKVYSTEIDIQGDQRELRPGMTCRAEIVIDEYADALYVPIQSVLRVGGRPTVYVSGPAGPRPRPIKVGLDNNRMVHVLDGLREGEPVLVAPPLAAAEASQAPDMPPLSVPKADASKAGGKAAASQPTPAAAPGAKRAPAGAPGAGAKPAAGSPKIDFSKLRTMSREERRKFFENLTPEQREQMRKQFGGRRRRSGGERPGGGRPGGGGPGRPDRTNDR